MRDHQTRGMHPKGRRGQRPGPIARFRDDESGAMIIFGLVFFIIILMFTGISVDVSRHEALRAKLQNTLDAGVLAAAAVNKTNAQREAIFWDYMNKAGLGAYVTSVKATGDATHPSVSATAKAGMTPIFMQLDGVNKLTVAAAGTAAQAVGNLEISLVLDVSNSMNDYDKIGKLKAAAKAFVDQMFKSSTAGTLTISVVPYSTQVTAGPDLLSYFKINPLTKQDYSYCLNFANSDFDTTAMPALHIYDQAGNFDPWYISTAIDTAPLPSYSDMYTYWGYLKSSYVTNTDTFGGLRACSKWSSRYILPWASTQSKIDSMIDGLVANGNTSIDVGMKWGAGLLDPSTQHIVSGMIADKKLAATSAGRPANYSSGSTMKVIVVMTDGANTSRPELTAPFSKGPSNVWGNKSDPNGFSIKGKPGSWHATQWYWTTDQRWHNAPYGTTTTGQPDLLTWPQLWEAMSIQYYLNNLIYPTQGSSAANSYWNAILDWMNDVGMNTPGTQDNNLVNICDAAKKNHVVIYSIGFMAAAEGKAALQKCATLPSYYYDVQNLDIATAFDSIANSITKLRLMK